MARCCTLSGLGFAIGVDGHAERRWVLHWDSNDWTWPSSLAFDLKGVFSAKSRLVWTLSQIERKTFRSAALAFNLHSRPHDVAAPSDPLEEGHASLYAVQDVPVLDVDCLIRYRELSVPPRRTRFCTCSRTTSRGVS